ncbi:hypothetical protein SDC9_150337 [bioreactor metagenome]|uniref:Uncharacterized protein n=1 Tax=bioreactor metagenome TaxID=1076179 RepID=A0A645ERG3_9ZZZZ
MDQTFNPLFNFNKGTKVSEVANGCRVGTSNRIFLFDIIPWIGFELFYAERHFSLFAIERKNNSFHIVANFHKVLCTVQMLCPTHFRYVNQAFNARCHFNKCSVIGNDNNFSFNNIADFQAVVHSVPRMWS